MFNSGYINSGVIPEVPPAPQHWSAHRGVFHIFGKTVDAGTGREHPHVVEAV